MANEPRRRRASGGERQGGQDQGGEHRSGPIAGTAVIAGVTFQRKALQFAEVDGQAIFEGDIVLGPADMLRAGDAGGAIPMASLGITGPQFRWPNSLIPYEIAGGMANQQRITDAIAHWEANTSIRFVVRDASNAATYPDFVHFQDGGGCSSMVGKRGGSQNITLGGGCGTGNAIHEIGHTVGLWHEQSREDRDSFVRIEWANIDPALSHNFDQHIADGDDLGPYDYGSIMHYPATAFSINGQPTIVPLQPMPPGVTMGQRTGLSPGDIAGVQMMYPSTTMKEVPKDGILDPTIKELGKDPITDPTIKEVHKDPIQDPTLKEVHKDPIFDPTFKETAKDPIHDPTVKEVAKDPVRDPTFKEVRKDPAFDPPTIKEAAKDPIQDPVTIKEGVRDPIGPNTFVEITPIPIPRQPNFGGGFGDPGGGASPFVIAGASNFGDQAGQAYAQAVSQVQELAQLVAQAEQQYQQLAEAYASAVAALQAFGQGQG
jgi:hypothetical protein